jgi:hypothetical protein
MHPQVTLKFATTNGSELRLFIQNTTGFLSPLIIVPRSIEDGNSTPGPVRTRGIKVTPIKTTADIIPIAIGM